MGKRTTDHIVPRLAKVRINDRKLTLTQANGLNVHLRHEELLPLTGDLLAYRGGYTLMGQLAVPTKRELEAFFTQAYTEKVKDKSSEAEMAEVPRHVRRAMEEVKVALAAHGFVSGMRIRNWGNMATAA